MKHVARSHLVRGNLEGIGTELLGRRVKHRGSHSVSRILLRSSSRSLIARAGEYARWHRWYRRQRTRSLKHTDAIIPSRTRENLIPRAQLHRARRARSLHPHRSSGEYCKFLMLPSPSLRNYWPCSRSEHAHRRRYHRCRFSQIEA